MCSRMPMLPAKNYDKPPPSSNSNFQTRAPNALKISVRGAQHPPSSNDTISGINADNFFKHLQSTWVHLSYYVTDFYEKWRFRSTSSSAAHSSVQQRSLSTKEYQSTQQNRRRYCQQRPRQIGQFNARWNRKHTSTHNKTTRRKITAKNHSSFASAQYAMKWNRMKHQHNDGTAEIGISKGPILSKKLKEWECQQQPLQQQHTHSFGRAGAENENVNAMQPLSNNGTSFNS